MALEIMKELGKTELTKTITNKTNSDNYFKKVHQIQVFRRELPLILERIQLEQRIELLEKMIPKIEIEQMESLQDNFKTHISQFGIQRMREEIYGNGRSYPKSESNRIKTLWLV